MYCLPEDYGGNESKVPMCLSDLSTVSSIYSTSENYSFCCSVEFVKLAKAVMSKILCYGPQTMMKVRHYF